MTFLPDLIPWCQLIAPGLATSLKLGQAKPFQECFWTETEKVGHPLVLGEDIIRKTDEPLVPLFNILWSRLKRMMVTYKHQI